MIAEGATVNTTDASLGNAFSETQVKELPSKAGMSPICSACRRGYFTPAIVPMWIPMWIPAAAP